MTTMKKFFVLLFIIMMLFCSMILIKSPAVSVFNQSANTTDKTFTVVIDAGHGGFDSGKVGIDGTLEKDINLSISKKLQKLLCAADIEVLMTRTEDTELSGNSAQNQKRQDMLNRASFMNQANADCIISIHQNSYPEESIDGAQVFYYTGSDSGHSLAALIQNALIHDADPSNHRTEKSNDSYYLFKNVSTPVVIVECGFLSNFKESKKLVDDTYQQKLAWAIHIGILQYLNGVIPN